MTPGRLERPTCGLGRVNAYFRALSRRVVLRRKSPRFLAAVVAAINGYLSSDRKTIFVDLSLFVP
jgi:hypothetical protein